jgi:hypothetical protein
MLPLCVTQKDEEEKCFFFFKQLFLIYSAGFERGRVSFLIPSNEQSLDFVLQIAKVPYIEAFFCIEWEQKGTQ